MQQSFAEPYAPIVAGWIVFLIALAASRVAATARFMPDRPNHRSSHVRATSKAGGLAIIGAWIAGMLVITAFGGADDIGVSAARLALLAVLALAMGLADDRWDLAPPVKFAGQFAIAFLFVSLFGSIEAAPLPFIGNLPLGGFGGVITVLWVVGFMNAYNFMDGANGLAAGCAVIGLCVFAVTAVFLGPLFAAMSAILLGVATFGFFTSNYDRGKIFMGDSGSQGVGFLIAALAVIAADQSSVSILTAPVIFLPLIFDVVFTLGHRLLRRKNLLHAHREHLYQLLIRSGRSHRSVAILYMAQTAFASAAALLMLTLNPEWQWLAPAGVTIALSVWAFVVFRNALSTGLLD